MKIRDIDIKKIIVKENIRTRIESNDLSQLMEDIKQHGLLHPIGLQNKGDEFILTYGHRRLEACTKLGWESIPAIVFDKKLTPEEFISINVSENIHRVDNTPAEFSRICKLLKDMKLNNSEIAVRLSVPKSKIETALRIYSKIPKEYEKLIGYIPTGGGSNKKGKISSTVANKILGLRIKKVDYKKIFDLAKKEEISSGDIEVIGKLISEGMKVEEAMKERNKYTSKSASLVVRKESLHDLQNESEDFVFRTYVRKLVKQGDPTLVY